MPIEFTLLDGHAAGAALELEDWDVLSPAFDALERRSGVRLDCCGTTRISPEQCQLLIDSMTPALRARPRSAALLGLLRAAVKQRSRILVSGE